MKQTSTFLSTYAADVSGVCSALYELGGMVIMHDASGCNSTYNTHDEPRWYETDSMVYISALTEMDAMLGNDEKLIGDICKAAKELHPNFIAVCGSPIPMIMGTDFSGIARVIEMRTGIPSFGCNTNGMHSYLSGIDMALFEFAKRFCVKGKPESTGNSKLTGNSELTVNSDLTEKTEIAEKKECKPSINLLGVTPLDFSINGNAEDMKLLFEKNGYKVNCCFAMGSTLEELTLAADAGVNVVVSSCGISLAKYFRKAFGIPYVVGLPAGNSFTGKLFASIDHAAVTKENQFPAADISIKEGESPVYIIGEPVFAASLRYTLCHEYGYENVIVLSPFKADPAFLTSADKYLPYESDIRQQLKGAAMVIADPLYQRILPKASGTAFLRFPHEAYSGRIYREELPVFIGKDFNQWFEKERQKVNQ